MAKENKKSLIIWAVVALVIGVILGLLITNITTTGQAKSALQEAPRVNVSTNSIYFVRTFNQNDATEFNNNGYYFIQYYSDFYSNKSAVVENQHYITHNQDPNGYSFSGAVNYLSNNSLSTGNFGEGYYVKNLQMALFPIIINNPRLTVQATGYWTFEDGSNKGKTDYQTLNDNGNPFIAINSLDVDCSRVTINHSTDATPSFINYYVGINDPNNNYEFIAAEGWQEPRISSNGNQSAQIPESLRNILNSGNEYAVNVHTTIVTDAFNTTVGYYNLNMSCNNGNVVKKELTEKQLESAKVEKLIPQLIENGQVPESKK